MTLSHAWIIPLEEAPGTRNPPHVRFARTEIHFAGLPAEDRRIEGFRAGNVASVEIAPVPGAGFVDQLCPLVFARLPHAERRPSRIGEDCRPAGVRDVSGSSGSAPVGEAGGSAQR